MWKPTILTGCLVLALSANTYAAGCGEQIERLAQRYEVNPELPKAETPAQQADKGTARQEAQSITTDKLAQSGGVIEPPNVGRTRTIEPAPNTAAPMPTPNLRPHTSRGPSAESDRAELDAGKRMELQALLQAARAADKAGKEEQCLEQVGKASSIAQLPK